jgi:chloramphenicol O-acetyltransferase type A
MSQIVNFAEWPRYKHYKIFAGMESPHLTVSFNIDVKPLLNSSKNFFSTILFLIHRTCEEIPEFRYRIQKDASIVFYESIDISFNILAKDGLFSNHRLSPIYNFEKFNNEVQLAIKAKNERGEIQIDPDQDQNLIVTSFAPWFSFLSIREPVINKNDSIPRITWGKYTANGQLPMSVQAHHGLIDGLHLGKFYEILSQKIIEFSDSQL